MKIFTRKMFGPVDALPRAGFNDNLRLD